MKKLYRKKPVVIEALHVDKHPALMKDKLIEFVGDSLHCEYHGNCYYWFVKTLEGDMIFSEGDYIIRGVKGEFYPCKPDIFELTYEEVVD